MVDFKEANEMKANQKQVKVEFKDIPLGWFFLALAAMTLATLTIGTILIR